MPPGADTADSGAAISATSPSPSSIDAPDRGHSTDPRTCPIAQWYILLPDRPSMLTSPAETSSSTAATAPPSDGARSTTTDVSRPSSATGGVRATPVSIHPTPATGSSCATCTAFARASRYRPPSSTSGLTADSTFNCASRCDRGMRGGCTPGRITISVTATTRAAATATGTNPATGLPRKSCIVSIRRVRNTGQRLSSDCVTDCRSLVDCTDMRWNIACNHDCTRRFSRQTRRTVDATRRDNARTPAFTARIGKPSRLRRRRERCVRSAPRDVGYGSPSANDRSSASRTSAAR